ncbi:hypothetical protein HK105_208290 [Polyrhizophydium stewartii]|uniref:Enoyl reductase (ER) domain-containing protein n=1 Tax=Polyrhizophydium stewartii TaxID=2732419 RepID=A0ABR4MY52_9FUNG
MRAIVIAGGKGDASSMSVGEVPKPVPRPRELLVKVHSFCLNRMDILQRNGLYPPPPGASEILGVEFAGEVVQLPAEGTGKFHVGDKVFGLVYGGAYAEFVAIDERMAIAVPEGMSLDEASAIPEVWFTATQALFLVNRLQPGEDVLIHAGASGVGTAAIQLARQHGADDKARMCESLGATTAINYKTDDFAKRVHEVTGGRGVDVIVDFVGASYWDRNLESLAIDGRMVMLAFLGGAKIESSNIGVILRKRLQINGSSLRSRTLDYQIELRDRFVRDSLPLFANGSLKPVIDRVFSWHQIGDAHRHMESNASVGKIVVHVD